MNTTLDYYNQNAQQFIDDTFNANIQATIEKFSLMMPTKAKILDVGCGSGRDSKYFLEQGFDVVAFDASESLAKLASEKINHSVLVKTIGEMTWVDEFDGVWAMASLLHLPKSEFEDAISRCFAALKVDGQFFCSLKIGQGEGLDAKGRFFSYYTPEELKECLSRYSQSIVFDVNEDSLGRAGLSWVNFIAKKPAPEYYLAPKNQF